MHRAFAILLCLLFACPAWAVATSRVSLSGSSWTDLGAGPITLTSAGNVVFAIGDVTPTIPLGQGFALPAKLNQVVNTTSHIWAMGVNTFPAAVIISPINAKGGGGGGRLPHRYWQVLSLGSQSYGVAEFQFRTTAGTPKLFSGGTASASVIYGAGYEAVLATDNNISTFWATPLVANPTWQYDYGAGNAVDIVEISIIPRQDIPSQGPPAIVPRWSDDGTTWTSMKAQPAASWTTSAQIFPVVPRIDGPEYWRISVPSTADGSYVAIAEVQFRQTAGTPQLFLGGTTSISSALSGNMTEGNLVADNQPSSYWVAVLAPPPQWWQYDYGVGNGIAVAEITIQARPDSHYDQAPTVFTPQWSTDGVTWHSKDTITTAPWTSAGQIQTFSVTGALTGILRPKPGAVP